MRLEKSFLTHETDGEQIMVSTDIQLFSGIVRSNETAAIIIDCLQEDTTIETIVQTIVGQYEVSYEVALADVKKILDILRKIGALEE